MEFPGENIAATVAEKVSDIVIAKMNINEEKRNREFTYQLKELEFYKSGYDKELRALFDYWTDLVSPISDCSNNSLRLLTSFASTSLKEGGFLAPPR